MWEDIDTQTICPTKHMSDTLFSDFTNEQRKQIIDSEQTRSAFLNSEKRAANYRGSMYWQTANGQQYLYREYSKAHRKSLGPRSAETEKILADFKEGKIDAEYRLQVITQTLSVHQKLNAVLRFGRTPNIVIDVLEGLRKAGLQDHLMVIGTNALFAYECYAGVHFQSDITTTTDVDLLWDSRKKITLLERNAPEAAKIGLIGVLQKVDKSFKLDEGMSRAENKQGFMVDLIKRRTLSLHDDVEKQQMSNNPHDFWASKIRNMDWLLSSPRVHQVVVGINGKMTEMTTIDPRAFALYKVYLARKDERDPQKAPRDIAQAQAVYQLVTKRLPNMSFDRIHNLPERLRDEKVLDILDPNRLTPSTITKQFGAVQPFSEHSGVITFMTPNEVIQHIGRERYVVWDRTALHGAPIQVGEVVTISQNGQVLQPKKKGLER